MNSGSKNLQPLGDFKPSDQWQVHVNTIFYGVQGPGIHNHFQTYVSRDYRLAHALAEEYYQSVKDRPTDNTTRYVHEWGVGNGNLAACFLTRLREIDKDRRVYPITHYILCDYSMEILKGVRANPRLQEHAGRYSTIQIDANALDCFRPGSADKIMSNEIWDDLATKVLLKHQGTLYEEYLQPLIDPSVPGIDFDTFSRLFTEKALEDLKHCRPFLDAVVWERSFQRVAISDWPYVDVLRTQQEKWAEEIPVPVNLGAAATLETAYHLLSPDSRGYSGMDYGMLSMEDLNQEGRPYFNLYGGQYTFMVNFELLAGIGKAIGFHKVHKEHQHHYVGRHINQKVASVLEIVQTHPHSSHMAPWDRDLLMVQTLEALNGSYRSPYKQKMKYPAMEGTPKKQRKQLAEIVRNLSTRGVPDTVAYVTESEIFDAANRLERLGYAPGDLQFILDHPQQPVSFVYIIFQ